MPPRGAPNRGQNPQRGQTGQRPDRGRGRGRGRGAGRGGGGPPGGMVTGGGGQGPSIADSVVPIGMKRRGFGTGGRLIKVEMNSYEITKIPEATIYQYSVVVESEKLPLHLTQKIVDVLQSEVAPETFPSLVIFDGKAIMYSKEVLDLGPNHSKTFHVPLSKSKDGARPPKLYTVKITKVGLETNTEVARLFVRGQISHDTPVQTAEMFMNTLVRMIPYKKYICTSRAFFTGEGSAPIPSSGLEIWRGYFQSVRPASGKYLLNFDVSSVVMFKPGPLIGNILDFLGKNDPQLLTPARLSKDDRRRLNKFFLNVRLKTKHLAKERGYSFTRLTDKSASQEKFTPEGQSETSIATYFKSTYNITLKFSNLVCVQAGKRSIIPLELCEIIPGQTAKVELSTDARRRVVEFSTMAPQERFKRIQEGFDGLGYGQSQYIRDYGMDIKPTRIEVNARILEAPQIKWSTNNQDRPIRPIDGKWNMVGKKFLRPATIIGFVIAIFVDQRQFNDRDAEKMANDLVKAAVDFGIRFGDPKPTRRHIAANHNKVREELIKLGQEHKQRSANKALPTLVIAVVPPSSADLYQAIKRFGIVTTGVATQCLIVHKCRGANHQYWANVLLKINVKLDGINFAPQIDLIDSSKPTVILGADVIHPPPRATERPSITSVVTSIDSTFSKYVARSSVQESGRGKDHDIVNIVDMEAMCKYGFQKWTLYQKHVEKQTKVPMRIYYFRDGVSEGEYKEVLTKELKAIRDACAAMKWTPTPKITVIVVGKRHHHRGMPKDPRDGDKKGNLPAGTTIDTEIVHPVENDYYQYTHAGLLGTSRPAHYVALHDENNTSADAMQKLTFGLAHAYARCTRSVSIPAPVYYADIVCGMSAIHFEPGALQSDAASQASGKTPTIEDYKKAFKQVNQNQTGLMYYM